MSAAKPDTWMPMYWGDYLRDTMHLSTEEHGAYMLLIGHYWTTGKPLKDDDVLLSRIARMTKIQWKSARCTISEFFIKGDGYWRHNRVEYEIANSIAITTAKSEAGKIGAKNRWQSHSIANDKKMAEPPISQWQNDAPSQPPSQEESKKPPVVPLSGDGHTAEEGTDGKPRRGKRPMPADWKPDEKHFAVGAREGYDRGEVEWQAEQFRDWAAAGAKRYTDWDAAFRNWIKSDIARRQIEGRRKAGRPGVPGTSGGNRGLSAAILAVGAEILERDRGSHPDGLHGDGHIGGYGEGQDGIGEPLPTPGDGRTIDGICEDVGPDDEEAGGRNDPGDGIPGKAGTGTGGRGAIRPETMAGHAQREVVPGMVRTEGIDRTPGRSAESHAQGPDLVAAAPVFLRN